RVVHVPGREGLAEFALDAATHALRFFSDWFGIAYPAQKLDLLAIPDFAFGAMENLGCVTFREAMLLVDPSRASRIELERIADVVAHEIAHMWFGDLVTMKWWNGIWLNEAFATMMELLCVDAFRPEWRRWVSFGYERDVAMATDGLHSTRPVEYPVGPPEEAQGMFDVLTYQKGAGVLRMLERYLGAEPFRDGIRRYLAAHRFANTETSDLWDALEAASGAPVRQIMDSWILQGGFPLVLAERSGDDVRLHQEPFAYAPGSGSSAIGRHWRIPVLARPLPGPGNGAHPRSGTATSDEPPATKETKVLLGDEPQLVPGAAGALVVNAGGSGYYRVHYDEQSLPALATEFGRLEALEQFNLVSDAWAALVAGRSSLGEFLILAEAVRSELDPDVWTPVMGALGFLDHVVDDETRVSLAAYTRALLGPAFATLGWEKRPGDSERVDTLRGTLLGTLGTVGTDEEIRADCRRRHAAYLAGEAQLDPDLLPAVVSVTAASGGEREFEAFLARHHAAANPQEELRYLYALAGFVQPELAERVFTLALTEVRTQNGPFMVQALLAQRDNGPATWARLRDHWAAAQERFPSNIFPRMLDSVKLLCRDPVLGNEVRDFLSSHPVPSGQRTVDQVVERLGVNMTLAAHLADKTAGELSAGIDRLSEI
ncbi:MAG TPA: M1 family aminopeptidase, partial [Acidimicrobiales bacterium]|nr:M1 family aminopeptidase [Acidimicrobiales bacterium]